MTKPKGFYPGWTGTTRCGWECGVYATDGKGGGDIWPIHGWYEHPLYGKVMARRRADGSGHDKHLDFILEPSPPETREVWVNEYPNGSIICHSTRSQADTAAMPNYIRRARKAILIFGEDEG